MPGHRPLAEHDFQALRFDTALRGYRMSQVDSALRRAAYDVGYKTELVAVLEAEVAALREGRQADADELRKARLAALGEARGEKPGEAPADAAADAPADAPAEDGPADEDAPEPVDLTKKEDSTVGERS